MAHSSKAGTAGHDRSANLSALRPVLPNLPDQGRCNGADRFPIPRLPAGYSLRPTWTRALPAKVDGRASFPIHPSVSSGVLSSSGFQITTGRTHARGQFAHDHG